MIFRNLLILLFVIITLSNCSGDEKTNKVNLSHELYNQSIALTKAYIDTLKRTPDSVNVSALMHRYEEQLTAINMKFPPGTDMNMSPDRNENLYRLTQTLTKLRRKHPGSMDPYVDSLKNDTIKRYIPSSDNNTKLNSTVKTKRATKNQVAHDVENSTNVQPDEKSQSSTTTE